MTLVESRTVSLPPGLVKMEERKRPASNEDADTIPPPKRQATTKESRNSKGQDADMPGRDDLEVSQPKFLSRASPSRACHDLDACFTYLGHSYHRH